MTQGRPKGCKAEIEVAKILEPWWAKHEAFAPDGNLIRFVRTPLSGGWGGKDTRSGFKASGDLMTTAAEFPFTVEIKRREGWTWKNLLAGKKSPAWGWWKQAIEQAREMKAQPLLWFRKNREPWHVVLPFALARPILLDDHVFVMAKRVWLPRELPVDYGGVLPALFEANSFLAVQPAKWLKACREAPPVPA